MKIDDIKMIGFSRMSCKSFVSAYLFRKYAEWYQHKENMKILLEKMRKMRKNKKIKKFSKIIKKSVDKILNKLYNSIEII